MGRQSTPNGYLNYETVDDHIAVVTLNRPEKRNAINAEITQGFDRFLKDSEQDPDVWVVILASSSDSVFCSGADLKEVADGNYEAMHTGEGGFSGFVYYPRSKPWIAAVKGLALGGGTELCLACDMIVAADTCYFGLPEVKRSLIAAAGGIARLARTLPLPVTLEMIATGEPIDAHRAYTLGLVNKIATVEKVLEAALGLARAITSNAPLAVRAAMRGARQASCLDDAAGRAAIDACLAEVKKTEDFHEGPRAFLEKRAPVWRGR
jgi:enoyl-CoA hydratase/carnithine racemase